MKLRSVISLAMLLVFTFSAIFIGCSKIKRVAQTVVERKVEAALFKRVAPRGETPAPSSAGWGQFMVLQAQIVFSYSFSAGGFWLGQTGYKPGELTKFELKAKDEEPILLEKAFLRKLDDGKEWWRVSWSGTDANFVYEALFSAGEDRQLLRLRARDANGNVGEVPVTSGQRVYNEPIELTKESIEGAITERGVRLDTPAGTFTANHVVYLAAAGAEGQVEWWLTDEVPGGVAKYLLREKTEGVVWTCTLKEKGSNATTILGSY